MWIIEANKRFWLLIDLNFGMNNKIWEKKFIIILNAYEMA